MPLNERQRLLLDLIERGQLISGPCASVPKQLGPGDLFKNLTEEERQLLREVTVEDVQFLQNCYKDRISLYSDRNHCNWISNVYEHSREKRKK